MTQQQRELDRSEQALADAFDAFMGVEPESEARDVETPALGFGVFQSPPEETTSAVETAIANGYSLVDTAVAYGDEREVGEAIRRCGGRPGQIFIVPITWRRARLAVPPDLAH